MFSEFWWNFLKMFGKLYQEFLRKSFTEFTRKYTFKNFGEKISQKFLENFFSIISRKNFQDCLEKCFNIFQDFLEK